MQLSAPVELLLKRVELLRKLCEVNVAHALGEYGVGPYSRLLPIGLEHRGDALRLAGHERAGFGLEVMSEIEKMFLILESN